MTDIYEYKTINISLEPSPDPHGLRGATIETAANRWAEMGWRTVAVMPSQGPSYADAILVERKKQHEAQVLVGGPPPAKTEARRRERRDD